MTFCCFVDIFCRYLKSSTNTSRTVFENSQAKFAAVKDCLSLIGFTNEVSTVVFCITLGRLFEQTCISESIPLNKLAPQDVVRTNLKPIILFGWTSTKPLTGKIFLCTIFGRINTDISRGAKGTCAPHGSKAKTVKSACFGPFFKITFVIQHAPCSTPVAGNSINANEDFWEHTHCQLLETFLSF